ncbi:2-succinyl-6-hydroxy-2,4-cyclohexadiene-1-carboxylate synthase [Richelia intracellularis]|nr:2-succinyl-6-hydroxy-2,4-cyclohexadiene-1-carboxylate synthase [Richelia intracellularis]
MENYNFHYDLKHHANKPLILFLHGFMGNHHEFDAVTQLLANYFSSLTIDIPGHGKTQNLSFDIYYCMEKTAYGIIQLLDKLHIQRCFLVGYSMGGRLALYLTVNFPERFTKVLLESASPGLKTERERLERIYRDGQIARKIERSTDKNNFKIFLENWYSQEIFGDIKNHPQFNHMISERLQNEPSKLARSLRNMGIGNQPSLWGKISENKIPLLLLVGEYDHKFIHINDEINTLCQSSQIKIIPKTGHNIHFENILDFVEAVKMFFN